MKIRTDFVTNSSSSSFVIAYKDTLNYHGFDEETLKKYPFLENYRNLIYEQLTTCKVCYTDDEDADICRTEEDLNHHFNNEYYYEIERSKHGENNWYRDYLKEKESEYEKYREYIKRGYQIIFRDVDHRNEELIETIRTLGLYDNGFVILEEIY